MYLLFVTQLCLCDNTRIEIDEAFWCKRANFLLLCMCFDWIENSLVINDHSIIQGMLCIVLVAFQLRFQVTLKVISCQPELQHVLYSFLFQILERYQRSTTTVSLANAERILQGGIFPAEGTWTSLAYHIKGTSDTKKVHVLTSMK